MNLFLSFKFTKNPERGTLHDSVVCFFGLFHSSFDV